MCAQLLRSLWHIPRLSVSRSPPGRDHPAMTRQDEQDIHNGDTRLAVFPSLVMDAHGFLVDNDRAAFPESGCKSDRVAGGLSGPT